MSILARSDGLVRLTIPREAVAATRPKVTRWATYYPGAYGTYLPWLREWFASSWEGELLTGPLVVRVGCVFERKKSHYRSGKFSHLLKDDCPAIPPGDCDNYLKGILDGMSGAVYGDDRQVQSVAVSKCYGDNGRVLVALEQTKGTAISGGPFGCFYESDTSGV